MVYLVCVSTLRRIRKIVNFWNTVIYTFSQTKSFSQNDMKLKANQKNRKIYDRRAENMRKRRRNAR